MMKHIPVLIDKVLETLGDVKDKTIIDCTFGAGGYTRAFLAAGANVIAFDRDPNVQSTVDIIKNEFPNNFKFINKPFSKISDINETVDAIVFDLGISSMQIDEGERGFSFRFDGPLDMRMESTGQSAAELIENSSISEMAKILHDFGDIKKAMPIARVIKEKLPKTTFELKELVHNPKDIAPVFQALRIAVNDELGEIRRALESVPARLKTGGICVCVTFHSLEDRLVKNVFREWATALGDPRMPEIEPAKFKLLKTFMPSEQELENNLRARSAHLRAVQKSC
ncbi:MAG: 16S rRNA (cytosine(1402)-N(4))-methyltransferase RsmH [Alphaproteobacteria bacterium]|nr:16S rRNA (cytosine(1402)-N(4))-methyltransferase RsmH [Alphaproteobacteria bacterium]MBN2675252.1 16S rRNA (cytosine(1402)-N(4))-methyltransferase RsmH [Alphaproteobacteria bacterium]